ncbi:MFS transporter [Anaerococcus sp. Marseille-Q5996]|uniref:MFS transporter n=1 Tax=Anaerococcus sp. Marseille-Q5996 TaxID=2972769 RepID=UPI0021C5D1D2|nr:MFS transporter [Anaerococcus sp. Marseille-Q5996]
MKKDLKIQIAILTIALYVASNSVVSGTLVFMQRDFGISITNAESLITISSIATIVTIFLSEKITQKIGMKKCVLIGLFLVGISSILPIINTTYPSVFISRLIMGAGVGLFNGHSANYINVFYEGDKAYKLHGIRNSTEFISQMVFLFIAGILIKIHWKYAFLVYFFAFFIMGYFNKIIPEVDIKDRSDLGKFTINRQIFFYVFFAAVMIMNVTALSVRFPTIATIQKGIGVDANLYMIILPMSGMIFGFLFGIINRILRQKTILLGLGLYVIVNLILAFFGNDMYIFLLCMVIVAFSQSLCIPYLFAEVSRFVKGSHARIANNLIFIGCNVGGFVAPFFLKGVNDILNTDSLTLAFTAFSLIYAIMLIINTYEYKKSIAN